ncbi:hypothetical protein [Streptomyces sp. NPDC004267]|uniref:hypothetical protein n=1 Tax=Streptomyces sp. NPDC004267 TaxID=3364694 RepID=UPI003688C0AA
MNTAQRTLAAALLAGAALGLTAAPSALAADAGADAKGLVGLLALDALDHHGQPSQQIQQATVSGNASEQTIGS